MSPVSRIVSLQLHPPHSSHRSVVHHHCVPPLGEFRCSRTFQHVLTNMTTTFGQPALLMDTRDHLLVQALGQMTVTATTIPSVAKGQMVMKTSGLESIDAVDGPDDIVSVPISIFSLTQRPPTMMLILNVSSWLHHFVAFVALISAFPPFGAH